LAQQKLIERLEKLGIDQNAPKHGWRMVKSWLATGKRKGVVTQRLQVKFRSTTVEKESTRRQLRDARIPAYLTVNLGLA